MREERNKGIDSASRSNSVEQNLKLWEEMKAGTELGLKCCMRAKIDMKSVNGTLRDPTLYRCNLTPHHITKDKYKLYPLYDFACPIVDSIEGVTHAMRSSEYHERNEQYVWIVDAFKLRKPTVVEFSRLNFVYTTLSKRKLNWFVKQGIVESWADPRFPTVRGMIRHGLVVPALREFIISQGFSKAANNMEWDQLWAINKKHIDPIAHRYVAVSKEGIVPFHFSNYDASMGESIICPLHPKIADVGNRPLNIGPVVWIERDDAKSLRVDEELTLMHWGNAIVRKIETNPDGSIVLYGELNLKGDYRKTEKKITFVADRTGETGLVKLIELDHLITKATLSDSDSFENFVTPKSWFETDAVADLVIRKSVQKGQIVQLERRGYFICDENPVDVTLYIYKSIRAYLYKTGRIK